MQEPVRFDVRPYAYEAARELSAEIGVSHVLAQVLTRRGFTDGGSARRFLAAEERHLGDGFGGLREGAELILSHVRAGTAITVHGDYDCDGVCSTAVLVRALRTLGARVDWYLPSRTEDGYGLARATVERLAEQGTGLLITADCAITAVEEVAVARTLGMDVVVTDHHSVRADGALPDALIVHPAVGGYACPELCATGVAWLVARELLAQSGADPAMADEDLDLVALATVADVVPLVGENRWLVRAGLKRLASTGKPGLRALMAIASVDPSGLDAGTIGFRLAPRINAAGRLARADAGLELLLTTDPERATAIAQELDRINMDRRDVETRIRFEAEAMLSSFPDAPAYVLAGEGWHPGVIGIVAARIAERHYRPTVLIALDGDSGSGSGRSIPGFDLLAGLDAGARHLLRHGGHRAAAGLTIERSSVDAFREAFVGFAASELRPEDLVRSERVDAVVPGDALGLGLAEELSLLEPFGQGNPAVNLLVPAASLSDPRPMGEGRHVSCSLHSGGARSRAVRFGSGTGLPDGPCDIAVRLERNAWNGVVEPRVVVRAISPASAGAIAIVGAKTCIEGVLDELEVDLAAWGGAVRASSGGASTPEDAFGGGREVCDARGVGFAGLVADLCATSSCRVLVVAAHAAARRTALAGRLAGFDLCDWHALEREPEMAAGYDHVVALDPPCHAHLQGLLERLPGAGWTHMAWGTAELRFAQQIHEWEYALREPLAAVYRALRAGDGARGEALEALLRGEGPQPRTAALAGRLVRILTELRLAVLDRDERALSLVPTPSRTNLERSEAFLAYGHRLEDGRTYLTTSISKAA